MNKFYRSLVILTAFALFATACGAQAVQAQAPERVVPKVATYGAVLGKSLNDKDVADFMASNYCSGVGQVQLCPSIGLAFWVDPSQRIKTVYLYASESSLNAAYKGELPFGLTMHDTMATVEQKFGQPKEIHAPQAGWEPGLPDKTGTTDHVYYWAAYERFGVTIVYNTPSASDKSATIYAILVSK